MIGFDNYGNGGDGGYAQFQQGASAGGGGGGGYREGILYVTPGDSVAYVIGGGGGRALRGFNPTLSPSEDGQQGAIKLVYQAP